MQSLLHVSCITNEYVEKPEEVFKVGDRIKCMVRRWQEGRSLQVSTKELEVTPGDMLRAPEKVYETAEQRAAQVNGFAYGVARPHPLRAADIADAPSPRAMPNLPMHTPTPNVHKSVAAPHVHVRCRNRLWTVQTLSMSDGSLHVRIPNHVLFEAGRMNPNPHSR